MMTLLILFLLGYAAIILEQNIRLNKAASALITGILCWVAVVFTNHQETFASNGAEMISGTAGILFFLLGAMTIVELIDAHDGFDVITSRVRTTSRRKLLIITGIISFLLSAVLDNLTTAIIMMSLVSKIVSEKEDRMYLGGMIIIAANAGGAWTPIGDVTTTMLWVGGQITTMNIITKLILPSLVCLFIPMIMMSFRMKGNFSRRENPASQKIVTSTSERNVVFFSGILLLLGVPVFKQITHLPPFFGMLLGLGILWAITEFIHKKKNDELRSTYSVAGALQRIDTPSILFFLGILLAVHALEAGGILHLFSEKLNNVFHNINYVNLSIGLASSIVDNVPLVAGAQGMYPLSVFPTDHSFWEFLAYCAGTGGSILIIGSAAGVAVMGIEKISFGWYLRRISIPALLGYLAGATVFLLMN